MRALVTGAGGFAGQWLCRALLRGGWDVAGTTLGVAPPPGILTADEIARITWSALDLADPAGGVPGGSLDAIVEHAAPDALFHLAAVAYVPAAAADAERAVETNVGGARRLLRAASAWRDATGRDPLVLIVGSGEQYGRHDPASLPLSEERHPCHPRTLYGATKCSQEAFALAAMHQQGLRVVATRSFNHSGRGQKPPFLLPALVERVLAARALPGSGIPVGNTETVRDFLHVEDVAGAYIALALRGRPGEVYNVCSGEGVSVGAVAAEILAQAGVQAPLRPDPSLQRPAEVPHLVGDSTKLRRDTGWTPLRSRADIIADLLHAAS